jgi:copper chaperone NosL
VDRYPQESNEQGATRPLLIGAAMLLVGALLLPLWSTRMVAPQYQGTEALEVHVYAGRVTGDIHEIELLNQYVGVHLPLDTPELKATPWILGMLVAVALASVIVPSQARMKIVAMLLILMLAVAIGGAVLLQYRLFQMGHARSPSIMARVPDFTPPILGSKKIANFTVYMTLGAGAWSYLGALLLIGWAVSRPRLQARRKVSMNQARSSL